MCVCLCVRVHSVTKLCPTLWDPMGCSQPGSSVHGILQARIPEWVAFPISRVSSHHRIKPRSPALQADSLPAEPQGKPKNTGVGSLSLLQQIFPAQELNQGLLHCRRILYQLSYEGSQTIVSWVLKNGNLRIWKEILKSCMRLYLFLLEIASWPTKVILNTKQHFLCMWCT